MHSIWQFIFKNTAKLCAAEIVDNMNLTKKTVIFLKVMVKGEIRKPKNKTWNLN